MGLVLRAVSKKFACQPTPSARHPLSIVHSFVRRLLACPFSLPPLKSFRNPCACAVAPICKRPCAISSTCCTRQRQLRLPHLTVCGASRRGAEEHCCEAPAPDLASGLTLPLDEEGWVRSLPLADLLAAGTCGPEADDSAQPRKTALWLALQDSP